MSKEITLENVNIVRVDFSANHHGGLYQPTIWVKIDGRSVGRMRKEGYTIKPIMLKNGKGGYILPVSVAVPYNSKSLSPRFRSTVAIEYDGISKTFDTERDREDLKWIDYANIKNATIKILVCNYFVNGRSGLKPYLKNAIFHIDRYIDISKIYNDTKKVNLFVYKETI